MKKILSKRTISLLLALLFIIPLMFFATACGENDANVAKVSTYDELVEALNGEKEIVKLTNDIEIDNELKVNRKLILDMNGKSIYNTKDIWNLDIQPRTLCLLKIDNGGDLTIKGNGSFIAKENDCYGIFLKNGTLLVENGTIKANCSAIQVENGTATILDGKFEDIQKADKQYIYTLNLIDANYKDGTGKIIVKGGEFVNFNPANCTAEGPNTNFVAEGYKAELVEGSTTNYKVVRA